MLIIMKWPNCPIGRHLFSRPLLICYNGEYIFWEGRKHSWLRHLNWIHLKTSASVKVSICDWTGCRASTQNWTFNLANMLHFTTFLIFFSFLMPIECQSNECKRRSHSQSAETISTKLASSCYVIYQCTFASRCLLNVESCSQFWS